MNLFEGFAQGVNRKAQAKTQLDLYKTKLCPSFQQVGLFERRAGATRARNASSRTGTRSSGRSPICSRPGSARHTSEVRRGHAGKCGLGDRCKFAHDEKDLRHTPDMYKTALCHNYSKGSCKLGDKCRFAHGEEELRKYAMLTQQTGLHRAGGVQLAEEAAPDVSPDDAVRRARRRPSTSTVPRPSVGPVDPDLLYSLQNFPLQPLGFKFLEQPFYPADLHTQARPKFDFEEVADQPKWKPALKSTTDRNPTPIKENY
jgi:hypothetical protein